MQQFLAGLAWAATAAVAWAQSPLTTTFANNNTGNVGGGLFFDLTASAPITILGLELNLSSAAGTTGSIEVFTCPTTRLGNQLNLGAWTMVATGAATSAGPGLPTPIAISPIVLGTGTVGVALRAVNLAHAYTNGNGTNQVVSTLELTLTAGEATNTAFSSSVFTPRVVNCNIHYIAGSNGVAWASVYGAGCIREFASCYEFFNPAGAFDLSSSGVSFVFTGTSYVALPLLMPFLAPSPAATALQLTDESEATMPLLAPFPFVGGSTNALTIHSNGCVAMAPGNFVNRTPGIAALLNAPQTAFWSWHDYAPIGPGPTGQVMFEQVGPNAVVTWNAVPEGLGTPGVSTWQMQFDTSSGLVHLAYQSMSLAATGLLVGYSPGGGSDDPGNRDLSASLPLAIAIAAADIRPLRLRATSRPLLGGTCNLLTTEIPAGTPFGAMLLGAVRFDPGLDLTAIGMPGCFQHIDPSASLLYVPAGASHTVAVAIPPTLPLGLQMFVQAATLSPPLTPLGVIASNGMALTVGSL